MLSVPCGTAGFCSMLGTSHVAEAHRSSLVLYVLVTLAVVILCQ